MSTEEILLNAEEKMEKAVEVLKNQLAGIRTGRATPGLVDSIKVEAYGSPNPLKAAWRLLVHRNRSRSSFDRTTRER